ncbi:MAG: glutamate racemase [Nevskiales bacterium]
MADPRPIGIFDSGVGGLSVWREIARQLPNESTIYFADQAHVPYGPRGTEQIRHFSEQITRFLIGHDCKAVVVACNTASAAALKHLRETFPELPTIGMEPAVKPATESTRTRVVGIMATPATFQGKLFQATAGRHAQGITLISQVCTGLAEQIEAGKLNDTDTEQMLRGFIQPMLDADADTIVLACSHYPFALDSIRRIAGPQVNVIDPAPAIARHLGRVLGERAIQAPIGSAAGHLFFTSGDVPAFRPALLRLVGQDGPIRSVAWDADGNLGIAG